MLIRTVWVLLNGAIAVSAFMWVMFYGEALLLVFDNVRASTEAVRFLLHGIFLLLTAINMILNVNILRLALANMMRWGKTEQLWHRATELLVVMLLSAFPLALEVVTCCVPFFVVWVWRSAHITP